MGVIAKRSSMTFFSDNKDHYCHRVRIVLAEKGVAVDIIDVDPSNKPEDLATLNPYNELPTLVDRELTLYHPNIMMEYLDERFPHPPLLPVYPVERARSRLLMHRIHRDWEQTIDTLIAGTEKEATLSKLRKEFAESLAAIDPIFAEMPFFMNEDFTLVDCCMAALMWRLPSIGVELQKSKCGNLLAYADRLFARESFQASLTDAEREMRL